MFTYRNLWAKTMPNEHRCVAHSFVCEMIVMTEFASQLQQCTLHELDVACMRETQRYRQGKQSDPRYCLEIFRRAIAIIPDTSGNAARFIDEQARNLLVTIYTDFIKAQIQKKVVTHLDSDDIVQQVWLRFWQAMRTQHHFETLQKALAFLQLTVATTIIEQRRVERRQLTESLEKEVGMLQEHVFEDPRQDIIPQIIRQRFRERCREVLTDLTEWRVFWMRYAMGYAPRDIAQILAAEGISIKGRTPTARLVSDLLGQIMQKLGKDPEIGDLLRED